MKLFDSKTVNGICILRVPGGYRIFTEKYPIKGIYFDKKIFNNKDYENN